jgi:branched-subunit amino acid aminotransferase/4-amino-4-deoxychorismate lyase
MSFFETIAIRRARPLFAAGHLDRLARAVGSVGGRFDAVELASVVEVLSRDLADGLLRIYVTAGAGAIGDRFLGDVILIFESMEVGAGFSPLRMAVSGLPYVPRPGGWKSGNYWQNADALVAARRAGCDEALLFNPAGGLASAATANVFLKVEGRWVTPAVGAGARDGVVREWVMERFGCGEGELGYEDVTRCSSCCVTSSRVGIRSVAELDGRRLVIDGEWEAVYRGEVLGD